MSEFTTALKKVRGLGSAKTGVHHWVAQRFTAITNIILTIWLFCVLGQITQMDYNAAYNFMGQSTNAVCALLFLVSSFYHAKLGLQTVIEDYVHCKYAKIGALVIINAVAYGAIISGLFWVLKISL